MKLLQKEYLFLVCNLIYLFSTLIVFIFRPNDKFISPIPLQYLYYAILIGLSAFLAIVLKRGAIAPKKNIPYLLFITLLIAVGFSSIFSLDSYYSMRYTLIFGSASILSFYICYSLPIRFFYIIFILYVVIITLYSLGALILPNDGTSIRMFGIEFAQRSYRYMYVKRFSSFTQNPNMLGVLILISIPMSLYFITSLYFKIYYKLFFLLSLTLNMYVLINTFSRSAIFGALISITFYFAFYFISRNTPWKITLLLMSILVILLFSHYWQPPVVLKQEFKARFSSKEISKLGGRDILWNGIFDYVNKKQLFGLGFGNSELALYQISQGQNSSAHNMYLGLMLETGLPLAFGFILFLILILTDGIMVFKIKTDKQIKILTGTLLSCMIGLIFQQFGEFMVLRTNPIHFIFLVLFAFSAKISNSKHKYIEKWSI